MHITVKNIVDLIEQHGINANQLSIECGLNNSAITEWKKGKSKPSEKKLQVIADYFKKPLSYFYEEHVNISTLKTKTEEPTPSQQTNDAPDHADYEYPVSRIVRMPIIGIIAAGYDGEVREEHIGDVSLLAESLHGFPPEDCFVLRVSGNSMLPELKNGDLVLIHRQSSVDSGTIAAVMYDDCDATLKKVEYEPGCDWMLLVPLNPDYPTKRIEKYDLNQCRILGKLVSLVERHY